MKNVYGHNKKKTQKLSEMHLLLQCRMLLVLPLAVWRCHSNNDWPFPDDSSNPVVGHIQLWQYLDNSSMLKNYEYDWPLLIQSKIIIQIQMKNVYGHNKKKIKLLEMHLLLQCRMLLVLPLAVWRCHSNNDWPFPDDSSNTVVGHIQLWQNLDKSMLKTWVWLTFLKSKCQTQRWLFK